MSVDEQNIREMELPRTRPLAAVQPKFCELVAGMVPGEEIDSTTNGETRCRSQLLTSPELAKPTWNGEGPIFLNGTWLAPRRSLFDCR